MHPSWKVKTSRHPLGKGDIKHGKEKEHAKLNEKKWDLRAKTFDDRRFNYFRFMQKRLVSLLGLEREPTSSGPRLRHRLGGTLCGQLG